MIEELAVGAQFNLPYIHVLVNNAYLGLIRQSQRGFEMDYHVPLSFDNVNAPEVNGYGVDHVKVAEGLGCKAIRVFDPDELPDAFDAGPQADGRVPGAGGGRGDLGAGDQHLDGHRAGQRDRVRGAGACAARTPRPRSRCWTDRAPCASSVAPDKFKGCLTAAEVAEALAAGLTDARPDLEVIVAPGRRRR